MTSALMGRLLCVAAHPGDETIGVGAWLARVRDVHIVHVTDGAPRDARHRTRPELSREADARTLRAEMRDALAVARMAPWRATCLGAAGLEAIDSVVALAPELARIIRDIAPKAIVTHAYEGGHPDHDATALLTYAACVLAKLRRTPGMFEMTSWRCRGVRTPTQSFLTPNLAAPRVDTPHTRRLSCEERARKRAMLDCFASRRAELAFVPVHVERIRFAQPYAFDSAPHTGPLPYELRELGSGEAWRAQASMALSSLDLGTSSGAAAE
jgi:LmbE family N-acetylglucosaminyl deacetylase